MENVFWPFFFIFVFVLVFFFLSGSLFVCPQLNPILALSFSHNLLFLVLKSIITPEWNSKRKRNFSTNTIYEFFVKICIRLFGSDLLVCWLYARHGNRSSHYVMYNICSSMGTISIPLCCDRILQAKRNAYLPKGVKKGLLLASMRVEGKKNEKSG